MSEVREGLGRSVLKDTEVVLLEIVDDAPLFVEHGGVQDDLIDVHADGVFLAPILRGRRMGARRLR